MNTIAIVFLVIAITAACTLIVAYMVKKYILWGHDHERAKIESTWKAEQQQAELTLRKKEWRESEQLDDTAELFPVGNNTEVYSPYPVEMTDHEKYIFNIIAGRFDPHFIFADTYISKSGDTIAQIDIIALCAAGIIVIEAKDFQGWILGDARDRKWMQILAYGHERHPFNNPIKQNASHIAALRNVIDAQNIPFYSLIVFGNKAELRGVSSVPGACYILTAHRISDVINKVLAGSETIQSADIEKLANEIRQMRIIPTCGIRNRHSQWQSDTQGSDRIFQ